VFASQAPPDAIDGLSVLVEQELELNPFKDGAEATGVASLPLAPDRRPGS